MTYENGTTEANKNGRRERIAAAIMAGIYNNVVNAAIDGRMAAKYAVDGADALIAELDKRLTSSI